MLDLSRSQTRVLFELSNGKQLLVTEQSSVAVICGVEEYHDPRARTSARFNDFLRLRDTECLLERGRAEALGLGDVVVYGISPNGIETLLETSMRPAEE